MADELRIGLAELLCKAKMDQDTDFLREGVRVLSQAIMEMEVEEHVGASRHERTEGRTGQRNGYRERTWGNAGGRDRAQGAQGERLKLFPLAAETASASREGALCGGAGSVRARGLHAQGR